MNESSIDQLRSPGQNKLLHTDLPTPLYYQMFTILRDHVLSGKAPVGTQLPTEFELANSFGVSRITAKRALDDLAAAGYQECVNCLRMPANSVLDVSASSISMISST